MDGKFMEEGEAECVRLARDGDGEAFEALFHAYYPMTLALAFNLIGRHHDAEEIVQETFIKAAKALPRFRGNCSLKTWLYRITMNTATDFRRRQRENVELKDDMVAMPAEPVGHPLSERLRVALESLSYRQRQAIVLTYFEGMNHAEAAAVLECAETTVSWRIFAAKRKLRKTLSHEGNERGGGTL